MDRRRGARAGGPPRSRRPRVRVALVVALLALAPLVGCEGRLAVLLRAPGVVALVTEDAAPAATATRGAAAHLVAAEAVPSPDTQPVAAEPGSDPARAGAAVGGAVLIVLVLLSLAACLVAVVRHVQARGAREASFWEAQR